MGRPRKIENTFDAPKSNTQFSEGQKSKGILDDYAVRGDVATKEGTIQHTPTAAKHIVNKEYVDDKNVESFPTIFSAGSVIFSDGTNLAQDNANLFWDDANNRLGIGTNTPEEELHIESQIPTILFNDLGGAGDIGKFELGSFRVNKEYTIRIDKTHEVMHFRADGNVGIGTTSPDTKLQVVGDLKVGDDNTNYMNVGTTGDVTFVGGAGLIFGAMYNNNTSTTLTITDTTPVEIPSGFTAGQLNGVTFANARELTVTEPGMYKIDWSISFNTAGGSGQDIEGAIGVNNTKNDQGTAHRFIGTATDIGNIAGTAILDLADNSVISLFMINNTDGNNIVVTHASLSLVQVGGT